jgi:predicted chitinase
MIAQINLVARLMKWIILVDIVLCILLYLPDQVREFYRITVVSSLSGGAMLVVWIVIVGATIWLAANQIVLEAESQLSSPSGRTVTVLRLLPIVMGVLPILVAALAQLESIPAVPVASGGMLEVGSIVRIQATELESDAARLRAMFGILLGAGLLVGLAAWFINGRTKWLAADLNQVYFSNPWTLLVTAAMITAATAVFVKYPVGVPQAINVFGIVAIFTICISSFVVHITLITDRWKIAILPIILVCAALIAALGLNDNHTVRRAGRDGDAHPLRDVSDDFLDWLKRSDRVAYAKGPTPKVYPVFIVAAQGGGAYAAYNAASFLARMQDLCPTFRHHLFAISSVSGGSVGAATFAAALDSEDDAGRTEGLEQINAGDPCPQMTKFLARERAVNDLGKQGTLEGHINNILRADFLSPLVAAALFPDFTQTFLPAPVPAFDRARALEYAFEASGREILERRPDGTLPSGILQENYFRHWNPRRSFPALLFNATDAGTGKRVVISPFKLTDTQKFKDEVCLLANSTETDKTEIDDKVAAAPATLTEFPLPLSTASFISARFPWVTPAATVEINNPCFGKNRKVRLVDGGYLDNSGVETALALVERLKRAAKVAREQGENVPEVGVHLISLTGGDFPTRSSYAFNDALEPIRALLSGRETRAYIALNRAQVTLTDRSSPAAQSFGRTDLRSMFYRLPLGWSLSQKTRNVITHESGRYWDCEPGSEYTQTRTFLSNADCIQLHVNFLLKGSLPAALKDLQQAEKYKADFNSRPVATLDAEALLGCYEGWWNGQHKAVWDARNANSARARLTSSLNYQRRYLSFYQAEQVRDLLREWDVLGRVEDNPNMLAFVLASLSHDTLEFRRAAELLSFESVSTLNEVWGDWLKKVDDANQKKTPPVPPVDRSKLLNNPMAVAQVVWAGRFGNLSDEDTWNYRGRGLFQIFGREQYAKFSRWIGYNLIESPDAVWNRRASARVAFAHYVNWRNDATGKKLADFVKKDKPDWKGARENDTEGSTDNPEGVSQRSEMFLGCIKRASRPITAREAMGDAAASPEEAGFRR